jgi:DNA-binding CsgD family transcriptional regulator
MSPVVRLVLTAAPGAIFYLKVGRFTVGRSPACDVYLPDPAVSRVHATLLVGAEGTTLVDEGSRNGTFIDDARVARSAVGHGVRIDFGHVPCVHERLAAILEEPSTCSWETAGRAGPEALTPAERRVFRLLLEGHAEKQIAHRLGSSRHTVHNHVRRIYQSLGVHSRPELLAAALRTPRFSE